MMNQTPNLAGAPAPTQYNHQGEACYFDQWQKRFVPVNDFQTLKQCVGHYLETALVIPAAMIQSAMPFRTYRLPSERVGDFVVEYYRQGKLKPLIFVKCSNQTQALLPSMITKAHEAAMELGSRYLLLTNGTDVYFAQLNQLGTEYEARELATYDQLIPETAGPQTATLFVRQTQAELADVESLRQRDFDEAWYTIGHSVKADRVAMVVNLAEALFDHTCPFAPMQAGSVEIVADLGLRYIRETQIQGFAPEGYYRSIRLRDTDGQDQVISFLVATAEIGGKETSALFCLLDDEKQSYQVLQLDLNRSATVTNETYQLWHNGRLAKRRDDQAITEQIQARIQQQSPDLLVDGKITFIALPQAQLLTLANPALVTLLAQVTNYALIRNTFLRNQ